MQNLAVYHSLSVCSLAAPGPKTVYLVCTKNNNNNNSIRMLVAGVFFLLFIQGIHPKHHLQRLLLVTPLKFLLQRCCWIVQHVVSVTWRQTLHAGLFSRRAGGEILLVPAGDPVLTYTSKISSGYLMQY